MGYDVDSFAYFGGWGGVCYCKWTGFREFNFTSSMELVRWMRYSFLSREERRGRIKTRAVRHLSDFVFPSLHTWPHPHDTLQTTNYIDINSLSTNSKL